MTPDAIDVAAVTYVGGSPNLADWPVTSEITELGLHGGTLHLRHTKEGDWPDVPYETTTQEATLYVFASIGGQWYGTGAERIRPDQHDKPEPDRVSIWIREWLYDGKWGALAQYVPTVGELVGICLAAGIERVANTAIVRERTPVYLIPWPGDAGGDFPPWASRGSAASAPPPSERSTTPESSPAPSAPAAASSPLPATIDWVAIIAAFNARFDRIEQALAVAATRPWPTFETTITLPGWLGGKQTVTWTPQPPTKPPTKR